jgi:hypothetical protein
MTRTWLPEAHSMPDGYGRHRPVFRWYREARWKFVPGKETYPSAKAAREAAQDYLAAAMNAGRTETENAPTGPETALAGKVLAWRQERQESAGAERIKVFGSDGPSTVMSNGREVPIVRRRRRG